MIDATTDVAIPDVGFYYSVNNGDYIHSTSPNNGSFCLPPFSTGTFVSVLVEKQGYRDDS